MANKAAVFVEQDLLRKNLLQADWMLAEMKSQAQGIAKENTHIKAFIGFDRAKAIIYPNTSRYPG